jgi:predicted type IV restriction endonuclease
MFAAQKNEKEKLILCLSCLRKTRIRNTVISGLLLILVLGIIAGSIFFAIV